MKKNYKQQHSYGQGDRVVHI